MRHSTIKILIGICTGVVLLLITLHALVDSPDAGSVSDIPLPRTDPIVLSEQAEPHRYSREREITGTSIELEVCDEEGEAIAYAEVVDQGTAAVIARTDETGISRVESNFPGDFAVSADGFQQRTFHWTGKEDEHVVLFRQRHSLKGVVRFASGEPAAGAEVLAWKGRGFPSMEEAFRSVTGSGTLLLGTCDVNGAFDLECPDEASYQLAAGMSGYLSCNPESVMALPDSDSAELVIRPAYGLFVAFEVDDGGRLRVPAGLSPRNAPSVGYISSILPIRHGHPGLVFSGVDPAWLKKNSPIDVLVLAAGDGSSIEPALGPITMSVDIPGYVGTFREFHVPSLANGIGRELVRLHQSAAGWGSLRLLLQPACASLLKSTHLVGAALRLRLEHEKTGEIYRYWIREFDPAGEAMIDSVPSGRYRVHLSWWNNEYLDLAPTDSAGLGMSLVIEPSTNTIDLRRVEVGAVEFQLHDVGGAVQAGWAEINFGRLFGEDGLRQSVSYQFKEPPYRIPFFKSGEYGACVVKPWLENVEVDGSPVFSLNVGEELTVVVRQQDAMTNDHR